MEEVCGWEGEGEETAEVPPIPVGPLPAFPPSFPWTAVFDKEESPTHQPSAEW